MTTNITRRAADTLADLAMREAVAEIGIIHATGERHLARVLLEAAWALEHVRVYREAGHLAAARVALHRARELYAEGEALASGNAIAPAFRRVA